MASMVSRASGPAAGGRHSACSITAVLLAGISAGSVLAALAAALLLPGIAQPLIVLGAGTLVVSLAFAVVSIGRGRARAEHALAMLLEHSQTAIFLRSADRRFLAANAAFDELVGTSPGAVIGAAADSVLSEEQLERMCETEQRVLDGETVTVEASIVRDGAERKLSMVKFPLLDTNGRAYGIGGIAYDVTEREQIAAELRYMSEHDPLTGALNRTRLIAELEAVLDESAQYRRAAVLSVDIDHLELANDRHGHAAGDAILKALAETLAAAAPGKGIVSRVDGDEFAVVLPRTTLDEALAVAGEIRARLSARRAKPAVTVSIGIAGFGGGVATAPNEVLACANQALYEAKRAGGDQARLYTGESAGAKNWVHHIQAALELERFVLYGQPIYDLRSGLVAHHELLLRMLDESGEIVSPGAFLPVAERFGLIREIDRWVTQEGLRIARSGGAVAINLSGQSIGEQPIVELIDEALHGGLDPSLVMFEITETAAMTNVSTARPFSETLDSRGCSVALDDFGTGFSSFAYLKHISTRYLKIDMEFVRGLTTSEADRKIVESIIQVARTHDKLTIAEGVEDVETLELLIELGADFAQGYHLGKPARLSPVTDFERALQAWPATPAQRPADPWRQVAAA
jgi:diguanylate cyclase (GGDEF)-like protein/PAS domain S-box-containing protein